MSIPSNQNYPMQSGIFQPPQETSAWSETSSKIHQFLTSMEGVLTLFSIFAGAAVSLLWSIPIGLLGTAAGIAISIAVALCRAPKTEQKPELNLSASKATRQPSQLLDHAPIKLAPAVEPKVLPINILWQNLNRETEMQLVGIAHHSTIDFGHRFPVNVFCPRETAMGFHANRIGSGVSQRSFIAYQSPLTADFEIFWKAVISENCSAIFDLTTRKDQVEKYYPNILNETMNFGAVSVKLMQITGNTFTYQVADSAKGMQKNITRFHFADWPHFGVVSCQQLNELVGQVEKHVSNPSDLVWVHCRAGVGRTGTLITALVLKEKIASGEVSKKNLDASLVEIIVALRKQRGALFVQQELQLNLLREYANSLLESRL